MQADQSISKLGLFCILSQVKKKYSDEQTPVAIS